ncbi:hypothetical protein LPU83_pLPU83b_0063 (plasmid) [Rhizobium favelukesii]|uniref:Uncharacterized protein n=1 Tax=Rhizobium favelukesii TaxID=348824 RepID=W6RMA1_9HYPH|nr:hypothetical protein LPU83_pLPU83b_0063 [Rhizobium favelukesii]
MCRMQISLWPIGISGTSNQREWQAGAEPHNCHVGSSRQTQEPASRFAENRSRMTIPPQVTSRKSHLRF